MPNNLKERHIRPFYDLLCAKALMPYTEFLGLIRTFDSCWLSAHHQVSRKKAEEREAKVKRAPKKR